MSAFQDIRNAPNVHGLVTAAVADKILARLGRAASRGPVRRNLHPDAVPSITFDRQPKPGR